MKKNVNEGEPQGAIKLVYDGKEDNYLINVVEGEIYYVDYEEEIEEMRKKLSELIIMFVEKYKSKTYGANMTAESDTKKTEVVSVVPADTSDAVVSENFKPVKLAPVKQTYIDSIEVEE